METYISQFFERSSCKIDKIKLYDSKLFSVYEHPHEKEKMNRNSSTSSVQIAALLNQFPAPPVEKPILKTEPSSVVALTRNSLMKEVLRSPSIADEKHDTKIMNKDLEEGPEPSSQNNSSYTGITMYLSFNMVHLLY